MSTPPDDSTDPQPTERHPTQPHPTEQHPTRPAPVPDSIVRRERLIVLVLAVAIALAAGIAWATIPTDEELFEVASTHENVEARIEAMNALVVRGYWEVRTLQELRAFLKESPPELRQFVADMHGSLLRKR
ncbi:MAG: hypothetical protein AAF957_27395 [Planctomycetota bacterium]